MRPFRSSSTRGCTSTTNAVTNNASLGDALFSGTPSGGGGVTISAGADNYRFDHNWVSGNLSSGDGGGVVHSGLSFNGTIDHNYILFNQSSDATLPTNGGGLGIIGANGTRTLPNGNECNSAELADCPPGLGDGTGANLMIDSNLIIGNSAESGSGGGLRLQQVNGTEVITPPYKLAADHVVRGHRPEQHHREQTSRVGTARACRWKTPCG